MRQKHVRKLNELPLLQRLRVRVIICEGDCWAYAGSRVQGYGQIRDTRVGRSRRAHIVSYELHTGNLVPPGMYVCHKCDHPGCINPDHLFVGTQKDNMADCAAKGRVRGGPIANKVFTANAYARTTCRRGHTYTEESTYWYKGNRTCLTCKRERNQRVHASKVAARQKQDAELRATDTHPDHVRAEDLCSISETARQIGVRRHAVSKLVHSGIIPSVPFGSQGLRHVLRTTVAEIVTAGEGNHPVWHVESRATPDKAAQRVRNRPDLLPEALRTNDGAIATRITG